MNGGGGGGLYACGFSAHGLKNEGCYICSTLVSAQCLKNKMRFFFTVHASVLVGLKNLESDTL